METDYNPPPQKKWQYTAMNYLDMNEETADHLGARGWELVGFNNLGRIGQAWFKREVR